MNQLLSRKKFALFCSAKIIMQSKSRTSDPLIFLSSITKFPVSHACEINFHVVIGHSTNDVKAKILKVMRQCTICVCQVVSAVARNHKMSKFFNPFPNNKF